MSALKFLFLKLPSSAAVLDRFFLELARAWELKLALLLVLLIEKVFKDGCNATYYY